MTTTMMGDEMAVMNHTAAYGFGTETRTANFFLGLRNYMARRAVYRQTVRELSDLNARELADLGISRSMIRSVAHEAAWGKK
ncbi:MAG: DUF1127 domain-containing protein [Paracoccus sp. (in: a-proteobacteria)]|uniref:DUF1127 domain-containing protein n=1 Tax=Paracoccus sp. TaxID=267 RepID=UPI0039E5EF13